MSDTSEKPQVHEFHHSKLDLLTYGGLVVTLAGLIADNELFSITGISIAAAGAISATVHENSMALIQQLQGNDLQV